MSSYRLRIDPLAEDDLSRAYQWYERQRPGLGGEFLNSVDKCFRRIVENPAAFQMVRKAARRATSLSWNGTWSFSRASMGAGVRLTWNAVIDKVVSGAVRGDKRSEVTTWASTRSSKAR